MGWMGRCGHGTNKTVRLGGGGAGRGIYIDRKGKRIGIAPKSKNH